MIEPIRHTASQWLRAAVNEKYSLSFYYDKIKRLSRSHLVRMIKYCMIVCINRGATND